jgi:Domain of unknown function (DUF4440)/Aspartyl protease
MRRRYGFVFFLAVSFGSLAPALPAQDPSFKDEIPIESCDRLPVVKVTIGERTYQFLVDTAASSLLNLKSFAGGSSKEVHIASWAGTAATSAREVSLPDVVIGKYRFHGLKLPAIDLNPIGQACGGPIDGILGMDLLDKMGATLDLKRKVASLGGSRADPKAAYDEMEKSMLPCDVAFRKGDSEEFEKCLDPEVVIYTPQGEFTGRGQVIDYFKDRFFRYAPHVDYHTTLHEVQLFGNALWYSYDYVLDSPIEHRAGHGMAMCRKSDGRWRILNLHNSRVEPSAALTR